ncbi:MAG: hypothetical protein ACFFB2_18940 [Promethearchaeota archaeon]
MSFPCSHCGGEESLADRKSDDFKPIVPIDLQGDFAQPPEFNPNPSSTSIPLSTELKTKPISEPTSKGLSEAFSTSPIVSSSELDVEPSILEGPPHVPTPLKGPPMKEAQNISRVVERMVTKTEDTDYRSFVKQRLLEIETAIQSIQTDIQSLIEGQKHIENMLIEKEEQEPEQESQKKKRWRK